MKRLTVILLCFLLIMLSGCTYLGATEEILVSSPNDISIGTIETFGSPQVVNPTQTVTDENGEPVPVPTPPIPQIDELILNKSSKKIHYYDSCSYAAKILEKNRGSASAEQESALIAEGYTVCSWCAKKHG